MALGTMTITQHAFTNTDADYQRIKQLLLTVESHPTQDNNWEPNRMDFWRYNYHAEKDAAFFQAHCRYWQTAAGQVVGLFISEYAADDFFIVVHPAYWALFPEILTWGRTVWGAGKAKITTDVYTFGQQKIAALQAAGFYEDGHVENVWVYSLTDYDFAYRLPAGFSLITAAAHANIPDRVALVQNAFGNPNFSEARLLSTMETPTYQPELDLVVVNAAGKGVAYCMGWVEENNPRVGNIEPMGTHTDYRQLGLGKALAKECFKRQHALGVETAWIASNAEPHVANYLYASLGAKTVKRSYRYTCNMQQGAL